MRKQILQISSVLALTAFLAAPAFAAGFDEDAAAPVGSFTSDMVAPHSQGNAFHERLIHFMKAHARHDRGQISQ